MLYIIYHTKLRTSSPYPEAMHLVGTCVVFAIVSITAILRLNAWAATDLSTWHTLRGRANALHLRTAQ